MYNVVKPLVVHIQYSLITMRSLVQFVSSLTMFCHAGFLSRPTTGQWYRCCMRQSTFCVYSSTHSARGLISRFAKLYIFVSV